MDSPCIKQTVCKVFKIFQCGKYLVAYVLKHLKSIKLPSSGCSCCGSVTVFHLDRYIDAQILPYQNKQLNAYVFSNYLHKVEMKKSGPQVQQQITSSENWLGDI